MKRYSWIIIGLLCMIAIGLHAVTRIVDITGAGQYTSIQTAVTASSAGDTVLVYPGRYIENINVSVSNIAIISMEYASSNPSFIESTIIDGSLIAPGIKINQNVQNIRIQGISITNSKSGIVLGQNSSSIIANCAIHGNASFYGGGINLFKGSATLSGVRIFNNYAYIMAGGIYINGYLGSVNVNFDPGNRCSIYNNTAGAGQDIVAHSINNDLSIPLDKFTVANPTSYYATPFRASGNEFQLLIDAETFHHEEVNHDLYVSPTGDDANDGLSPATALKTIRTAVYRIASDSLNQKTVHILPGSYSRTANQQVFPIPLKSWVKVKGAGIEETQIVGEMDPDYVNIPYNALEVFTSFYQSHASLEDLSITTSGSNNSCAIWGFNEESLHLKNLRMHDLTPDLFAIINITYATNCLWDGIIIEDFTTESMGFMYSDGYITGVIRNSIFRNATSTFTSNEVWANPLIWIRIKGEISFENCHFDNIEMMDDDSNIITIGYSSTLPYNNRYRLINCLFSNLLSHSRMMIMASPGYPEMDIINCTFSGNTSDAYILMVNGSIRIINSVFYNNSPHEIAINSMPDSGESSTITIDYSLFNGGYNGIQQAPGNIINYLISNIDTVPLFSGGDDIHNPLYYSLSGGSPCINAGTVDTTGLNLLPYDLAGNQRVWDGRIDMGCFEFGAPPVANDDPVAPAITETSITAYPNPFNVFTNIKVSALDTGTNIDNIHSAIIAIYNIKGQQVKSISLDPGKSGEQITFWDGRDANNTRCSSGIYLINLIVNGRNFSTRKVTFIR